METDLSGLDERPLNSTGEKPDIDQIRASIARPTSQRLLNIAQAFRYGMSAEEIHDITRFDPWFLGRIENIVHHENQVRENGLPKTAEGWIALKQMGFSDARLAQLVGAKEDSVKTARLSHNMRPVYKRIDSCAAEIPSDTAYLYSTYEGNGLQPTECEANPGDKKKIIILGGGPNRIGQGIEFDYCCVHACYALKEAGYETIMINCNPETVSTDYDTSDRLYFEPLTAEDVLEIIEIEQSSGHLEGVVVQLGGQTPLKLAQALKDAGVPILGTDPEAIDLAEDRERFQQLLHDLKLKQPPNGIARSAEEAFAIAAELDYPLVIRPSYVLGGRAMEIVGDLDSLQNYIQSAVDVSGDAPVLLDRYLQGAIEVDVDAIADGEDVFIAGIMEHIEEAGVHSGDSACAIPAYSLPQNVVNQITAQTIRLAKALNVIGLMNVQFALKRDPRTDTYTIYILEVNPRASRTVPFVAKATGIPVAKIASRIMAGEKLSYFKAKGLLDNTLISHTAVKEAVMPFGRFPGVDPLLGPEMRSTGEVMGIDESFPVAFAKSQIAASMPLPDTGTAFISVRDQDKDSVIELAQSLVDLGFKIVATGGTNGYLQKAGLPVTRINKVMEGHPHIGDAMINGEIQLMINTTKSKQSISDANSLRRRALTHKVCYYTTLPSAKAAIRAIAAMRAENFTVSPLQSYFPEPDQGNKKRCA